MHLHLPWPYSRQILLIATAVSLIWRSCLWHHYPKIPAHCTFLFDVWKCIITSLCQNPNTVFLFCFGILYITFTSFRPSLCLVVMFSFWYFCSSSHYSCSHIAFCCMLMIFVSHCSCRGSQWRRVVSTQPAANVLDPEIPTVAGVFCTTCKSC